MNKVKSWFDHVKLALLIAIGSSLIYSVLDYFYLDAAVVSGGDPYENGSWSPIGLTAYSIAALAIVGATVYLLVSSIGFTFRAAQWLKSVDPESIPWKPGFAIAGYLVPVISLVVPFLFTRKLISGGANSESEKKRTQTLLIVSVVLSFIATRLSGNGFLDIVLGGPELTFDEFVSSEWGSIAGSVFDVIAMAVMYFVVISTYKGLTLKEQTQKD